MPIYQVRKKYIGAINWIGSNFNEVRDFLKEQCSVSTDNNISLKITDRDTHKTETALIGDFITKSRNSSGSHVVFNKEFNEKYELVEE